MSFPRKLKKRLAVLKRKQVKSDVVERTTGKLFAGYGSTNKERTWQIMRGRREGTTTHTFAGKLVRQKG